MWASHYAFSLVHVHEQPGEKTKRLQDRLVAQTKEIFRTKYADVNLRSYSPVYISGTQNTQIEKLWSHLFAGLMKVGTDGIPNEIALNLARKVTPIPLEVRQISVVDFFENLKLTKGYNNNTLVAATTQITTPN